MTNEDWNKVKEMWPSPYLSIKLECDGYHVSLEPIISKLKLIHQVYVNGWIKGLWMNGECEEGRRFYQVHEKFVHSAKERAATRKHLGKAAYKRYNYDGKYKSHLPYWSSFAAFKKHLVANNKEIKLVVD